MRLCLLMFGSGQMHRTAQEQKNVSIALVEIKHSVLSETKCTFQT